MAEDENGFIIEESDVNKKIRKQLEYVQNIPLNVKRIYVNKKGQHQWVSDKNKINMYKTLIISSGNSLLKRVDNTMPLTITITKIE
jgi:hypothetical protein